MAVFIDNLAFSLFLLCFGGLLLLYVVTSAYLVYRRKEKNYAEVIGAAKVPLILVGGLMMLFGLVGEFTWPLPGSYNILFYDPLTSFGVIILAFGLSIHYKVRFEYVGFFGLMIGVVTIFYGIQGYTIGLTEEPIALLALYGLYGVAGIFSYPVALIMERLPGLQKRPWIGWTVCLAVFWLAMFIASLLAGYVGWSAIPAHLTSVP